MLSKLPQNFLKYIVGLITALGLRLIPHPPNVEPIMSAMMPFSKRWGWFSGMVFCFLSVMSFDLITGTLGAWSLVTAGTYTALGALSGLFFKNKESSIRNYVLFSVVGTLIYDAITGIGIGMLFFNQTFSQTFIGQIPFTVNHLMGNVLFSIVISPVLYKWVLENSNFETANVIKHLRLVVE